MRVRHLAVVVGVLALAGCTGPGVERSDSPASPTSPAGDPTPVAAPPPAPPEKGTCHRLSYTQAVSPSASGRSVPCARSHTSETYYVGRLDSVLGGRLLAVDSRRVERQVAKACRDRLADFLGGTEAQRRLTLLRPVWFTPTIKASDAGATWFRCDAVVVAGDERSLLDLDASLRGVLDTEEGRRGFGICGTAEPGTDGFDRVVCRRPHAWRAVSTVPLGGGDYPGEKQVAAAGEGPCREAGRVAAEDPLDFRWGYEWPDAEQWEAGHTYGVCWVPD